MKNNEVLKVKDLLCRANCIGRECKKCPYYDTAECINKADTHLLRKYVYELKDENNRLKAENDRLEHQLETLCLTLKLAKAEAVKEFAKSLKSHTRKMQSSDFNGEFWDKAVLVSDIDNLVKEMVGDM